MTTEDGSVESEAATQGAATPPTGAPRRSWLASNWARVKSFGASRVVLVVLALIALGVGLVNAFRAEASTAPLIVGAVLLLAAFLLAPEWREIRARHGETEVSILRGVETRLEAVTLATKTEEEIRAEIADLRADVQQAREAVERGDVEPAAETHRPRVYIARHSFSDGKVLLTLEVPSSAVPLDSFWCTVRDPDLKTASSSRSSAPYSVLPATRELTVIYPDEFADAQQLVPGTYLAEWRRRNVFSNAVFALIGDPVVARDSWTVEG